MKAAFDLELVRPSLPLDLEPVVKGSEWSWPLTVRFTTRTKDISILSGKSAARVSQGAATLTLSVKSGASSIPIAVVGAFGSVSEYVLNVTIEEIRENQNTDPKAFLVLGPVLYSRSLTREGTAVSNPGKLSATVLGVRGIYRRRVAKEFTDSLPGKVKIFFDGSGTLGKSLSSDPTIAGTPVWGDARFTLEVFQTSGFRIEGGAGFSLFVPGVQQTIPGDLEAILGFVLSARLGYPLHPKAFLLLGLSTNLPYSESADSALLVSQPFEMFAAVSTPRGQDGYWELRLKYYKMSTTGNVVLAGTYSRKDVFFGPEVLWIKRF